MLFVMIIAAQYFACVCQVVVDPSDYGTLLEALKSGKDDLDFRKRLAWKAYQHTATYDSTVAEWMWSQIGKLHSP